jgi:hypothetical protein
MTQVSVNITLLQKLIESKAKESLQIIQAVDLFSKLGIFKRELPLKCNPSLNP